MFKKKVIVLFALVLFFGAICFGSVAIAIYPCEGDFDCDGKVLYEDLLIFAADYGRTNCGTPCPPLCSTPPCPPPAPVEKTGQTTCYDTYGNVIACAGTGQDGDLQKGVAWPDPRFTDNDDGTVTDNLTGLIWLKNANCFGQEGWGGALSDCNTLASGSCGLSDGSSSGDWRLPNVKELLSLHDLSEENPGLPSGHPFVIVQSTQFWSSTTRPSVPSTAWLVSMNNSGVGVDGKSLNANVWPVRDSIE
jgi:hypothetical protein